MKTSNLHLQTDKGLLFINKQNGGFAQWQRGKVLMQLHQIKTPTKFLSDKYHFSLQLQAI